MSSQTVRQPQDVQKLVGRYAAVLLLAIVCGLAGWLIARQTPVATPLTYSEWPQEQKDFLVAETIAALGEVPIVRFNAAYIETIQCDFLLADIAVKTPNVVADIAVRINSETSKTGNSVSLSQDGLIITSPSIGAALVTPNRIQLVDAAEVEQAVELLTLTSARAIYGNAKDADLIWIWKFINGM